MLITFAILADLTTEAESNLGPIDQTGKRPTVLHMG
jgi:hypothetical protein